MFIITALSSPLFIGLNASQEMPATFSIDLHDNWSFTSPDTLDWMPATVPGTVHTDLIDNGVIKDPFYRTNEKDQQWIDKLNWTYQTIFELSEAQLATEHLELFFEGLDTYAKVYLNEQLILEADNFFRSWRVPVNSQLKAGENKLRIEFQSPTLTGLQALEDWGYPLPASNDQSENGEMEDKKVSIFTRKPGYHYGWDWGPRLVSSGIWGPVRLEGWNDMVIRDVFFHQKSVQASEAQIDVQVTVESAAANQTSIKVAFGPDLSIQQVAQLQKGINTIIVSIHINKPQLWWTHDLGEPYLYNTSVKISAQGQLIDEQEDQIGLREIKLIQEKDEAGESFYFQLNGVPIFAKGANYIPQDIFIPRVRKEQYQQLIESTKMANMNMLRVWGGGFYEKDIFYELCDQSGILVWQDFMFACSMYPGDEAFLENVRKEAEENVIRLRNHSSVALWCGNNEIDVAWSQYEPNGGWGWKQRYDEVQKAEIWQAYDTIFHHILAKAVSEYAPGTDYWPSSPQAGPQQHAGHDTPSGDIHYWGVWHGLHPFEDFNQYIGRFMSEYGFQSFPEFSTIQKFTTPEDWDIESKVMAAHQRSGIGNLRIKQYMEQYYVLPDNFKDMLYVGQVLQAEGMRMGFEAHRRAMPYCMGSLYWQINDCWPVASWSSMDYYQNWKALHYAAQKAFAPVLVSPFMENDSLKVVVVSDKQEAFAGVLHLEILDFSGNTIWQQSLPLEVEALTASLSWQAAMSQLVPDNAKNNSFLKVQLRSINSTVIAENTLFFVPTKDLQLPKSKISYSIEPSGDHWRIQLESPTLVKHLRLEIKDRPGHFSDNYFDLHPGVPKMVLFHPDTRIELKKKDLKLRSIQETL